MANAAAAGLAGAAAAVAANAAVARGAAIAGGTFLLLDYLNERLNFTGDLSWLYKSVRASRVMAQFNSYADFWHDAVAKHGKRTFIVFEGTKLTYKQVDERANQLANALLAQGYKAGDIIALLMYNRPEFLVTSIACTKIGVVAALINHNLRDKSLIHCINVASCKTIIFGSELAGAVEEIRHTLQGYRLFADGAPVPFAEHLNALVASQPTIAPSSNVRKGIDLQSPMSLIYTSGTTGLPKAAPVQHFKYLAGILFKEYFGMNESDVFYVTLPFFHSAAGVISCGCTIASGGTMILKQKFSASAFGPDIRQYGVTVFQYIGELCRYIVNTPPSPLDGKNKLRLAFGNGLRPEIWDAFQKRFNIAQIGELFLGTEHNVGYYGFSVGLDGKGKGSVGRTGLILRQLHNGRIVRFDVEKEEPVRGKDGFCIPCDWDEPGELLGKVTEQFKFAGYHNNEQANKKKILRDVFVKGDMYYRTGDLLKMDRYGYVYFVDRIGDSFRWHGENCSTMEISEVVSTCPGILEANVYGVQVPGHDGRAGMASVVTEGPVDWVKFKERVFTQLPSYAVPLFVRIQPAIEITGTFKHTKVALRNEGIDPAKVKDPMFWYNPTLKAYEPFGEPQYRQIVAGKAKL